MKAIALLLLACTCAMGQNLRLIGTNLYDFSRSRPASEKIRGTYHVIGKVLKTYPNSLQVEMILGFRVTFVPAPQGNYTSGDPQDTLRALSRLRQGAPSPGQALAMGMPGEFVEVPITSVIHLLNHPPQGEGSIVNCYAVPISKGIWDFGIQFTGNITNYQHIYRVLPTSIRLEGLSRQPSQTLWHFQQATNGYARYQFELGMRYLTGKEVETNLPLGHYWISKAVSQGYPDATNFIQGTNYKTQGTTQITNRP